MNETARDIIALSIVPGLGCRGITALLKAVDRPEDIFSLPDTRINKILKGRFKEIERIRSIRNSAEHVEELLYIEKEGITPICYIDKKYPKALKNIYDPPPILYCKGSFVPLDENAVAIVGSRKCSMYGMQMAEKLAFDLAERGVTVVSGMARGIDSAAHRGAVKGRGRTIAVMGSGFRNIYPAESKKLMRTIAENGAVITEFPSYREPERSNFPRRNRIISGISGGVVVVEAARKSGAIITADLALDQGREVFAVPGRVDSYASGGTNRLIQNGAKLVTNVDDILEELNIFSHETRTRETCGIQKSVGDRDKLSAEEENILRILKEGGSVHIDSITEQTEIGLCELPGILLKMELAGRVKARAGAHYILSSDGI